VTERPNVGVLEYNRAFWHTCRFCGCPIQEAAHKGAWIQMVGCPKCGRYLDVVYAEEIFVERTDFAVDSAVSLVR